METSVALVVGEPGAWKGNVVIRETCYVGRWKGVDDSRRQRCPVRLWDNTICVDCARDGIAQRNWRARGGLEDALTLKIGRNGSCSVLRLHLAIAFIIGEVEETVVQDGSP